MNPLRGSMHGLLRAARSSDGVAPGAGMTRSAAVDVAAVTCGGDAYHASLIIDGVYDPVVADPNAP